MILLWHLHQIQFKIDSYNANHLKKKLGFWFVHLKNVRYHDHKDMKEDFYLKAQIQKNKIVWKKNLIKSSLFSK